jgi:AraC-like DNA-binding protein
MSAPAQSHGPFADLGATSVPSSGLRRQMPGVVCVRKPAHDQHSHTSVPSDLFLVTVYCEPGMVCGTDGEAHDMEVVVSALRTQPVQFRSSGGGELAVALLSPLGLLQAFGTPMEGLADRRIPLAYFCGWNDQRALRETLLHCHTRAQRLQALGAWLERRIADSPEITGPQRRVAQAAMMLYESGGNGPSLDEAAHHLAIGRRQLERDFRRWLGVSHGTYTRLVRFQRAASAVMAGSDLIEAAMAHGYADQSHMTRTFRELALCTPGEVALWGRQPGTASMREAFAGRMLMWGARSQPRPHSVGSCVRQSLAPLPQAA